MTPQTKWHRHWNVRTARGSWLHRFLTKRRWHCWDEKKVMRSRFVYSQPFPERLPEVYGLSILGILHGLTGLTLDVKDPL